MLSKAEFITEVLRVARLQGYTIETNARTGLDQVDFGNKKLHAAHLADLYPEILHQNVRIPALIDKLAPGRPCAHKPMREILDVLRAEGKF